MEVITKYQCPICKSEYTEKYKAIYCMNTVNEPKFKVGDIVSAKCGYGWYDGNPNWIINIHVDPNKNHGFCEEKSWCFYYVITHIEQHGHTNRYFLITDAMKGGPRGGWTTDNGTHYTPKLIENAPETVVRESKLLIGEKINHLL